MNLNEASGEASGEAGGAPLRVLFIGKRFYTNKDALAERFGRIFELPLHWRRAGAEARLWLIDYHTREACRTAVEGLSIVSTPALSAGTIREACRAWTAYRPQVVVASGDCYIGMLGWALARAGAARFVFDVYDKYDAFRGYRRLPGFDPFRFLRRRADLALYASRPLAAAYAGERGGHEVAVVANGVDAKRFRPLDMAQCRAELGLPGDARLVGYFGSLEAQRGAPDLVAAAERLHRADTRVLALICGRPHPDTSLTHPWVIYRGAVPHELIPRYINSCDVVALPMRRAELIDASSSCKIAEYLACRRPIVASRSPNFVGNFPLQASELGAALCECGDPEDLARALDAQLKTPVLATPPHDLTWPEIAGAALAAIRRLGPPGQQPARAAD